MNDFQEQIETFKDLLDRNEMINLTILTEDGGSFNAHMEILTLHSDYFKQILENKNTIPWEVVILDTSKEIIALLIKYCYTGKLQLSPDKVKEIVAAAELLSFPDVIKLCKSFLTSKISLENCISIYNFAKYYKYEDLKESAREFMLENFESIYACNSQFLSLKVDDMISLLSDDALNVRNEEVVYWTIIKWIEADTQANLSQLPFLLRCLRVGLCESKFYEDNIFPNSLISQNEEGQHFLFQASQLFADLQVKAQGDEENGNNRLEIYDVHHPFLRPRVPSELIFVMGGWSAGSATSMIETYDLKTKRWFLTMYPDSMPRAYHGMLWHHKRIYVIGGFDGNQCFNSVRCFDPESHAWEERGCMHVQRCYVSVASVGKYIYAMGGYDGHRRNRSCERYDPEKNQWSLIANMHNVRSDASADSLDGKIYIAGGFNGTQVLDSAEFYDPEINQWTPITNMNSPRSGVKMLAFKGYIYVIGGFNGSSRLSTVERYDRASKSWTYVASMLGPRSNFAVAVLEGYMYAIGGFNGLATITSTEVYDPHTNTWKQTTDLNLNRSALSACRVSGIKSAHEYCYIGAYT